MCLTDTSSYIYICLLSSKRDNLNCILPWRCVTFLEGLTETPLVNKCYAFYGNEPQFQFISSPRTKLLHKFIIYTRHVMPTLQSVWHENSNSQHDSCAPLGFDTARSGNSLPTRNQFLTLEDGIDRLSRNVAVKYHYSLRNSPEERSSHPLRGRKLEITRRVSVLDTRSTQYRQKYGEEHGGKKKSCL